MIELYLDVNPAQVALDARERAGHVPHGALRGHHHQVPQLQRLEHLRRRGK